MKKLFTHENRLIVFNLKNLLHDQGINCHIENEFSSSGVGVLAPFETWPEIWVSDDSQFERAEQLINEAMDDLSTGAEWVCPECGEKNGSNFCMCWKCSHASE